MTSINADTMPKVGFRPYHETDAFGAAHLSGVGKYEYNRPFDPAELYTDYNPTLHGLGRNPFHESAWKLAGLGDVSDAVGQAVEEYVQAGELTGDQASAIMNGSNTFTDFGLPDPTDQGSWTNLVALFQQVNNDLSTQEAMYGQLNTASIASTGKALANTDPAYAQFWNTLSSSRSKYETLAQQFITYYRALTGSVPAGLTGLGIIPIVVWVAGAAVFLITATAALYAIHTWAASVNVRTIQATTAQASTSSTAATNASLTAALQKAQATGDTVTAQAIANTLAKTAAAPAVTDPTIQWIENNAVYIGIGIAALLFIQPIAKKLF